MFVQNADKVVTFLPLACDIINLEDFISFSAQSALRNSDSPAKRIVLHERKNKSVGNYDNLYAMPEMQHPP